MLFELQRLKLSTILKTPSSWLDRETGLRRYCLQSWYA